MDLTNKPAKARVQDLLPQEKRVIKDRKDPKHSFRGISGKRRVKTADNVN